jgi:transposase
MSGVAAQAGLIHLGMATSKDTIVVAALLPGEEIPVTDRIFNEEEAVRRLTGRFADRSVLRCCSEAGPGGYDLFRLLTSMGVACDVVAPWLVPQGGSDKVKADLRDSRRLARLHRAGELTPIRVPSPAEEAVRDLVRARGAVLADRKRARQRLTAVLMRHGRIWRGGSCWTAAHRAWIAAQRFGEPALAAAVGYYQATLAVREAELAAIEAELAPWAAREPLAPAVARLGCYRGIAELGGLTLAAEVVDWRRFPAAPGVHELHRAGSCRVLLRGADPPRAHHQGRLRTGAHRADRGRLVLPARAGDRGRTAPPPGRRHPPDPGPVLDGAAAAARPVRAPAALRHGRAGGGHRGRPRAGRVRLGRDDRRLTRPA